MTANDPLINGLMEWAKHSFSPLEVRNILPYKTSILFPLYQEFELVYRLPYIIFEMAFGHLVLETASLPHIFVLHNCHYAFLVSCYSIIADVSIECRSKCVCALRSVYTFTIFSTIHHDSPRFLLSENSGWIGINRDEKWKYSVSLRFQ